MKVPVHEQRLKDPPNTWKRLGAVFAVLVMVLVVVASAGCLEEGASQWGFAGFAVTVPVRYGIQYQSYDGSDGEHYEKVFITPQVDPGAVTAKPIYLQDFAEVAKSWLGQRIPALENQQGIEDDAFLMNNTEPDPNAEFVNYANVIGDEGHTVYCGGKWTFNFKSSSGASVYTKTVRNAQLVRIPAKASGTESYTPTTTVTVYIPRWKLPDEGRITLNCDLNYELQGYWITHHWLDGDVWAGFIGYTADLINAAIDKGKEIISAPVNKVKKFFVAAAVVLLVAAAVVAFPINPALSVGLAVAAVGLTAYTVITNEDTGEEEEVPALDITGDKNPQLHVGTGTVSFTVDLTPPGSEEGATDRETVATPGGG